MKKLRGRNENLKLEPLHGQPTRGGPPAWGLGEALTTPPREKQNVKKYS